MLKTGPTTYLVCRLAKVTTADLTSLRLVPCGVGIRCTDKSFTLKIKSYENCSYKQLHAS